MLAWFEAVGYDVDIPQLERTYNIQVTRFADWVRMAVKRA
jgi:hypothetical protein